MKQKSVKKDILVTESILKKELANYATKDDLKNEIKEALSNYPTTLKVEMMLEDTEAKIDHKARQYRDEVLNKMDHVVGELAQLREDRLFEKHEKKDLQKQIDNHDKRIKKLERQSN